MFVVVILRVAVIPFVSTIIMIYMLNFWVVIFIFYKGSMGSSVFFIVVRSSVRIGESLIPSRILPGMFETDRVIVVRSRVVMEVSRRILSSVVILSVVADKVSVGF